MGNIASFKSLGGFGIDENHLVIDANTNITSNRVTVAGLVSATGNVSGANFIGNGALLTSITGANVTGNVPSATIANTVTNSAKPNITSVGTLTSVTVSGNATTGNLTTTGLVSATGNVTGGNIRTTGQVSATGNITGNVLSASNVNISAWSTVPQWWFKGKISGTNSLTVNTDTSINWNSNNDPMSWWDSGNLKVKPTITGWYEVIARVQFSTGSPSSTNQINLQINVSGLQECICQSTNNPNNPQSMVATALVYLNGTTDWIAVTCWSSVNGQYIIGSGSSQLIVKWISN